MPGTQTLSSQVYGHYQILREAGRGGMSLVYEALDNRIGRRVALKVLSVPHSLSPEMREAMIARLKREARAIARLSHPNIVTIYDIGEEAGQHYIVMEFLEGMTLRDRLDQGAVSPQEVSSILDQVAGGLDAVHEAGIVHRDIKPSNVMLLPGGQVKLMDFGVARQNEDTMVTQAGSMVGSPVYMAPEQINGEACAAASDLWSLGILLYEMLAGHPPFTGGNIPNVLYQVTHRAPPPLPRAAPAVQRVLDRALDKNPARRFGSARELADAFRTALSPRPIVSPRPVPLPAAAPRASAVPAVSRAARPAALPLAWAAGLLLLALLATLPRLLPPHRRVASEVGTLNRPPVPAPAVRVTRRMPLPHSAPKPLPVVPHSLPVVRVAAFRQERTVSSGQRVVRRLARSAPTHRLRRPLNGPRMAHMPPESPQRYPRRLFRPRHPLRRETPQTTPNVPVAVAFQTPLPAASKTETGAGPNLLGTWHGRHSHNPATLVITQRQGNTFAGTMSVRTHEADVRIAVQGHVSPQSGEVSMRETRVLWASKPRAWDLGSESGHVAGGGHIEGAGTDIKGRHGEWAFSR